MTAQDLTGKGIILSPKTLPFHDRGGGARTTPLVTPKIGAKNFISGITAFEPGAAIPVHFHNCDESVMVLSGNAIAELDGEAHALSVQDTTFVPAGVPHRFINASQTEPMSILWIYASIEANRTIVATGDTRPIAMESAGPR
ncbi:cupin domain-containing protein [Devosia sp. YIM 151766]|uniref:cupin domain-containing protein n=1 Tax=Devosia sp. YIM 151766 TaxID=3017325 RepID=UPI00255C5E3D|nr:cupin domain-containing protein [Devosia sp. YIM 151766]WIY52735.1 cupin domain-containing protein [Devosia sp. YIM 151766]